MTQRPRNHLVVKLFPSLPRAGFGGRWLTQWLERNFFYREYRFTPWKSALVVLGLLLGVTWCVVSLLFSWLALERAEALRLDVVQRQQQARDARWEAALARRDAAVLEARLAPLDDRVQRLSRLGRDLAIITGMDDLAAELDDAIHAEQPEDRAIADAQLSLEELEQRYDRLSAHADNLEFELAHTPSISPLDPGFVPTDRYGYRVLRGLMAASGGKSRQFHAGLDLAAPTGTPVHATADGTVHYAGRVSRKQNARVANYGNFVVLDHGNGIRTVYAHCDRLAAESGAEVRRGDLIGWVGSTGRSTGPHLHYEVIVDGRPQDPELFILDIDIPGRRVKVERDTSPSPIMEEVDRLLPPGGGK
ncbi:MAG: peptidoglycan DD-metalloendopeptidase family protein [Acidobacteriota bacterium]